MSSAPSGQIVVVVVRRRVDPQQVQRVGGDVVVERRRRVGQQQLHAARARPQDQEELVVDVEQPEHGARSTGSCAAR